MCLHPYNLWWSPYFLCSTTNKSNVFYLSSKVFYIYHMDWKSYFFIYLLNYFCIPYGFEIVNWLVIERFDVFPTGGTRICSKVVSHFRGCILRRVCLYDCVAVRGSNVFLLYKWTYWIKQRQLEDYVFKCEYFNTRLPTLSTWLKWDFDAMGLITHMCTQSQRCI